MASNMIRAAGRQLLALALLTLTCALLITLMQLIIHGMVRWA